MDFIPSQSSLFGLRSAVDVNQKCKMQKKRRAFLFLADAKSKN